MGSNIVSQAHTASHERTHERNEYDFPFGLTPQPPAYKTTLWVIRRLWGGKGATKDSQKDSQTNPKNTTKKTQQDSHKDSQKDSQKETQTDSHRITKGDTQGFSTAGQQRDNIGTTANNSERTAGEQQENRQANT